MSLQQLFIASLERWTTKDLKTELLRLGHTQAGTKDELVARLQTHYRKDNFLPEPAQPDDQNQLPNQSAGSSSQNDGSRRTDGDNSGEQISFTPSRQIATGGDNLQSTNHRYTSHTDGLQPAAGVSTQSTIVSTGQSVQQLSAPLSQQNVSITQNMHASQQASTSSAAQNAHTAHSDPDLMGAPSASLQHYDGQSSYPSYDYNPHLSHSTWPDYRAGTSPPHSPLPPPRSYNTESAHMYPYSNVQPISGGYSHAPPPPWSRQSGAVPQSGSAYYMEHQSEGRTGTYIPSNPGSPAHYGQGGTTSLYPSLSQFRDHNQGVTPNNHGITPNYYSDVRAGATNPASHHSSAYHAHNSAVAHSTHSHTPIIQQQSLRNPGYQSDRFVSDTQTHVDGTRSTIPTSSAHVSFAPYTEEITPYSQSYHPSAHSTSVAQHVTGGATPHSQPQPSYRPISTPYSREMNPNSNMVFTPQPSHSVHQFQDTPNLASTRIRNDDHSFNARQSELQALEMELKILETREKIKRSQYNLTLSPEHYRQSQTMDSSQVNSSMLQLVKQSVDINSLPPSKPCKFTGDIIEYPKWRTTFDLLIETKDLQPHQKLVYLEDYLSGEALDLVKGYSSLNTVDAYREARKELDTVYGDPLDITEAYRDRLERWKRISSHDKKGLKKYSSFLNQCITTMHTIPQLSKLSDPRAMKIFPNALPETLVDKWARIAGTRKYSQQGHPSFDEYVEFVKKEAFLANSTTTSKEAISNAAKNSSPSSTSKKKPATTKSTTLSTTTESSQTKEKGDKTVNKARKVCHKCNLNDSHNTADCRKLAKLTKSEQQEFIESENLCFKCLWKGHGAKKCQVKIKCSKCGESHPTCLHDWKQKKTDGSAGPTDGSTDSSATTSEVSALNTGSQGRDLTTMILPVYISAPENPDQEILVYALIDTQSDTSFICHETANSLEADSTSAVLRMSTMTSQNEVVRCQKYSNLRIRGIYSDKAISIPTTYTQKCIPGNRDHISTPETARKWEHLQHLEDSIAPLQSCEIAMLIGFNCPDASLPLKVIKGKTSQPHAIKTILGWSIVGGVSDGSSNLQFAHRVSTQELNSEEILKCLSEDLSSDNGSPMSQNDIKFLRLMDKSTSIEDGFYTMPLPFKETPQLPDNRQYALKRFKSLNRRLAANSELNEKYRDFMSEVIAKGEAQVCQSTEPGWYIPHHGVFHPQKPGKLRVVFDCSASFKGESLNKQLLKGPDLNSNLAGLLCRFRKDRVAVTCDIQKMYHQFRVHDKDRKYLRFLWYKENSTDITDYQMNVHLFGATSSPSCAIYGLRKLATDHSEEYPKAADFIHNNFYVDDGLVSLSTPKEVIQLMNDAKALTNKGNLVLHKFQSNDPEVAAALGCDGPTTKQFSSCGEVSRALGLIWDIQKDVFRFADKSSDSKPHTRRGVLSTIASVFDPLGFLEPFTLMGKLLIQDLCKDKKDWDDPLSAEQTTRWRRWLENLSDLNTFEVPRCYLSTDVEAQNYTVELHLFSDACEYAYGTCAYLRILYSSSPTATVCLLMSKSRVGPQKAVTIPRLELQAATLSVKLADFLQRELMYENLTLYFWSDSETVLGYIANEAKAFHTFVCNRVQRIKDSSTTEQWHYVSTHDNPADIVSRGSTVSNLSNSWLHGPEFLRNSSFRMNEQPHRKFSLQKDDPEIRRVFTHAVSTTHSSLDLLTAFQSTSSWEKVTRLMSYILRFGSKQKDQDLTPQSSRVFNTIIKLLQSAYLSDELKELQQHGSISKKSVLFKLDPFIDADGVMRVGGRLKDALTDYNVRHPVVMPGKSHITQLFIAKKHAEIGHQGKLTTMNHIRACGVYLYGQGTRLVSSLIYKCVRCKRLRGKPLLQKMSNLPTERTEPTPPFTHVGMDVFGPFTCKDGRKEQKRYGLIFTCLASRAIHLELLEDMTTDSFINSFRCFTAIRGPVKSLLSDQGTNFIGARNEFRTSLMNMLDRKAQQYLKDKQCVFKFNVPSASHMGGVWERLIRTVRDVLRGILIERNSTRLDTPGLRTLFYECMSIINSRPLTIQQLNQDTTVEPLPLTPNTILTMKQDQNTSAPGDFSEPDLYSRKRWRRVQFLAEQFWSRWKTEYLQHLQSRQKWNDTQRNVQTGDIVLIADTDLPRCNWKLAMVSHTYPSRDGLIRKVRLHLGQGQELDRPIHKLVLLLPSSTAH